MPFFSLSARIAALGWSPVLALDLSRNIAPTFPWPCTRPIDPAGQINSPDRRSERKRAHRFQIPDGDT